MVGVLTIVGAVALAVGVYIALEPANGTPANGAAVATDGATTGGDDATKAPTASTPSPTHATTPTPTPTGTGCYLPGDGSCGPYDYSRITNSNGYNTYVANQMWGCGAPGRAVQKPSPPTTRVSGR